jgi:hypothetical protein
MFGLVDLLIGKLLVVDPLNEEFFENGLKMPS